MNNWFEFKAFAGSREIYIFDDIGKDGVTAKSFKQELDKFKGPIDVHINSGGGSVTEGISIYNTLKAYTGKKTVYINSLAASMASVIAMAGDTIIMPENALMMIHNPWGASAGPSKEHRKTADLLDVMKDAMIAAYQYKTGLDQTVLSEMMDEETWMNGGAALKLGFANSLTDSISVNGISAKIQQISNARDHVIKENFQSLCTNVRETAQQIITARKTSPGTAIFKTQNQKPSNYLGIK